MLNTNSEYLRPEIMDVLRLFDKEEEEFTHYFSYSGGKFYNVIEYMSQFYDFEDGFNPSDELEFKRYAKRFAKLAFYKVLSKTTHITLPWGALTGIRPTKLAWTEIAAGRDYKELFKKLCVSEENINLTEQIIKAQQGLHGGGKSLYVSIPFCPTKCDYCSFITAPIEKTKQYVENYIKCLVKELESVKPITGEIRSVYVGGGTPFVLSAEQLTPIYAAINDILPKNIEYTVEAGRPDVFTEDKLELSKKFGVNRICVNPQSFNDKTLEAIGRRHTAEQTIKAFEMAAKYGFDINIDLIAGLDNERCTDFEKSLDISISLNPANITVHTLSLKAGAKLKENTKRLHVEEIEQMIAVSRKKLLAAGYQPYYLYRQKYQAGGLENVGWCKPGKACLYNIDVMEELGDNIAVGANAISKRLYSSEERIERYATPKHIPTYISKISDIIPKRIEFFK
ncbi:MAG: coproporphyrinogen dehydrogenase HemZ [Clostridiales bacterium]|nr:coproporphyrinogen dehydrogenase HemZ [Clostridiales bacterium]